MKNILKKQLILLLLFFAALVSAEPTTESNINDKDLRTLIADFQYWRSVPGHFEGASWNSHVDAWNGTLHKIMLALDQQVCVCGAYSRSKGVRLRSKATKRMNIR